MLLTCQSCDESVQQGVRVTLTEELGDRAGKVLDTAFLCLACAKSITLALPHARAIEVDS
jgi:hypothetical protein